jgi:flagellar hook-length control protein FliK
MASNTPEKTSNAKPGDAAFDKLAAAAAAPVSDAARQIQTQTAQAPPQTPQVKPEAAPVEQTTQANLATPSLAQPAPIPRAETPRIGKNAAKTPDLRSADASEAKAFEQAVMQKSAPQPTAPVSQNKDAPAFTALISADAPAPALSQAPATTAPTALQTTQSQHIAAERVAAHAPPATAQVAREIVRRFDGANTRFELRLDPPELGRIEVRLDVSRDHRVTAVVAAESPQALAELVRHARELEQALQSAGLELADNGLSFDLRQSEREFVDSLDSQGGRASAETEEQTTTTTAVARPIGYERWRGVRLDMRV